MHYTESMISKDEIITFLKASEFFQALSRENLEKLVDQFEFVSIDSGDILINKGEVGDCLYLVISGRLRAYSEDAILGEMGRGDLIGELALLTHGTRAASVRAVRDSVLLKLSQSEFESFVQQNPQQILPIVRSTILRILKGKKQAGNSISTIAVAPAGNNTSFRLFAEQLAHELEKIAPTLYLNRKKIAEVFPQMTDRSQGISEEKRHELVLWLSQQETDYRYVVYETDINYSSWTKRCLRQADQIFLVATDYDGKFLGEIEKEIYAKDESTRTKIDLVLLHRANIKYPTDTKDWLQTRKVNQFHHVRETVENDLQRIVRYLTGQSIGLVLGGGGARGFVHIGIYKALVESGVHIDFFGGTSFGGLLACLFAMEKKPEEVMHLFKEHMLSDKKFFSMTAPLVSLNTGEHLTNVLKFGFGEPVYIEDIWKRFFCIVCNLSQNTMEIQKTGVTWKAMRATVSLPAIFPPITNEKHELLIDGGVANNLPVDVMRQFVNGGKVIASHVQTVSALQAEIPEGVLSGWGVLLKSLLMSSEGHYPNIAEVILRSIGLSSQSQEKVMMSEADYFIDVDARKFGLLDFQAMEKLVELGYRVAMEKLSKDKF